MDSVFRVINDLDRAIDTASEKYDTYAAGSTMNLSDDLRHLFYVAERARIAADQALLAAWYEGESARMVPVEKLVATYVTAATAFTTAATAYETRQASIASQIRDEAARLDKLATRMATLAGKSKLPRALPGMLTAAWHALADAQSTGDTPELHTLMAAVGGVFAAVLAAERAAL